MKRTYGWNPDLPDFRDHKLNVAHFDASTLPSSVDLRPGMPAVWDQGQLGSCTGFGISACVEYCQKKQFPQWDFEPSQLMLYYNERVIEGSVASDAGASIRDGIKSIASTGVCREDLWPYDITKFTVQPPVTAYANALKHKAVVYESVPQTDLALQTVLASGFPVVFGITVYASFESDAVAQSGVVPMPASNEQCLGGHCTCISGYDQNFANLDGSKGAYLVRNSWGTGWGLAGYFWLPSKYVMNPDLASDLWKVQTLNY